MVVNLVGLQQGAGPKVVMEMAVGPKKEREGGGREGHLVESRGGHLPKRAASGCRWCWQH